MADRRQKVRSSAPHARAIPPSTSLSNAAEAVLLLLCATLPAMVNGLLGAAFERSKVLLLLQGAGMLALLLFAMRLCAKRQPDPGGRRALPLPVLVGVALWALAGLLSWRASLMPGISLAGSYGRSGGVPMLAAGAVILFGTAALTTSTARLRRIVTALALGSVIPVAVTLAQRFGMNPLGTAGAHGGRPGATLGNPIFLGAHLVAVFPLTLWLAWRRRCEGRRGSALPWGLLGVGQIAAIAISGSRGPLLALLIGAAFGSLLLLLRIGFRRTVALGAGLGLLGLIGALLLMHVQIVRPMLHETAGEPYQASAIPRANSLIVRLHIYQAVAERMLSDRPLALSKASDGRDRLPPEDDTDTAGRRPWWRAWIGYGWNCQAQAADGYFPPALQRREHANAIIDSAHCRLLDIWIEAGLLGLAAYGVFGWGLLSMAARLIDPGSGRRASRRAALCMLLGMGVATVVLLPAWGVLALGVGLPMGMIAGVLLWLFWTAQHSEPAEVRLTHGCAALPIRTLPPGDASPTVALCVALLAMLVESQSAVRTVSASLVFWTVAGLLMAVRRCEPHAEVNQFDAAPSGQEEPIWLPPMLLLAALSAFLGGTLMGDAPAGSTAGALAAAWRGGVIAVVSTTSVFATLSAIIAARNLCSENGAPMSLRRPFAIKAISFALAAGALLLVRAVLSSRLFSSPAMRPFTFAEIEARLRGFAFGWSLLPLFAVPAVVLALWFGVWKKERSGLPGALPYALVALAAIIWATQAVVHTIMDNDVRFALGNRLLNAAEPRYALSASLLSAAAAGDTPWADHYLESLHRAYGGWARAAATPAERELRMGRALQALEQAVRLAPFDALNHERLGGFHAVWASLSETPETQKKHAQTAAEHYERALRLAPGRNSARISQARTLLAFVPGSSETARLLLENALKRDAANPAAAAMLAILHFRSAPSEPDGERRAALFREARRLAESALHNPWRRRFEIDEARLRWILDVTADQA